MTGIEIVDTFKRDAKYDLQKELYLGIIKDVVHYGGYSSFFTTEGYRLNIDDSVLKRIAMAEFGGK